MNLNKITGSYPRSNNNNMFFYNNLYAWGDVPHTKLKALIEGSIYGVEPKGRFNVNFKKYFPQYRLLYINKAKKEYFLKVFTN